MHGLAWLTALFAVAAAPPAAVASRVTYTRARALSRLPPRMAAASHDQPAPGDELPASVSEEIPPEFLAEAWTKQDLVKQLVERLKGCSLHVIGHKTADQAAVALALARRLKESRYRFLDLDDVVTQCAGGKAPGEIEAADGVEELRALESAVLQEAKAWPRCVLLASGPLASQPGNWAALHQGIVVLLRTGPRACDDLWVEESDVQVDIKPGASPDESALKVATSVLQVLKARPPKSEEWMKKRDDMLRERGLDPDSYDSMDADGEESS